MGWEQNLGRHPEHCREVCRSLATGSAHPHHCYDLPPNRPQGPAHRSRASCKLASQPSPPKKGPSWSAEKAKEGASVAKCMTNSETNSDNHRWMGRAQKIVRQYPFFARSARQFQSHTPRTRLGTMESGNGRCTCAWQVMLVSAAPAVRVCRLRPPARVCPEALGLQATGGAMRMSVQQRPASHLLVQEG